MAEPVHASALGVLQSLRASLHYSLALPIDAHGQVCLPQQWVRDWCTQAQVALALLDPTGASQDSAREPL